jgi:hypothetical protein
LIACGPRVIQAGPRKGLTEGERYDTRRNMSM